MTSENYTLSEMMEEKKSIEQEIKRMLDGFTRKYSLHVSVEIDSLMIGVNGMNIEIQEVDVSISIT